MHIIRTAHFRRQLRRVCLIAAPLLLFAIIRERLSWRPQIITLPNWVSSLAYAPDGTTLAIAQNGPNAANNLLLLEVQSRTVQQTIPLVDGAEEILILPDGKRSVILTSDQVRVGRLISLPFVSPLPHEYSHKNPDYSYSDPTAMTLAENGATLVTAATFEREDTLMRFWDTDTSNLRNSMKLKNTELWHLCATAHFLAAGGSGHFGGRILTKSDALIFDLKPFRLLRRIPCRVAGPNGLALTPKFPRLLAMTDNAGAQLCDISTGKTVFALPSDGKARARVIFSPDGRTLVAAESPASGTPCNILVWDVPTGVLRRTLTGHQGGVLALAFSPDSRILASGGYDATVRLWRIN